MTMTHAWLVALAFNAGPSRSMAQQPASAHPANPAAGCTATPAQIEANKKVAMAFFRATGAERVALADPSYTQHNPAFKKRAEHNKVSDYEEFRSTFLAQGADRLYVGSPQSAFIARSVALEEVVRLLRFVACPNGGSRIRSLR